MSSALTPHKLVRGPTAAAIDGQWQTTGGGEKPYHGAGHVLGSHDVHRRYIRIGDVRHALTAFVEGIEYPDLSLDVVLPRRRANDMLGTRHELHLSNAERRDSRDDCRNCAGWRHRRARELAGGRVAGLNIRHGEGWGEVRGVDNQSQ